ncbi:MAG: hypothetical protein HZB42_14565 [Sphingobacteriales bacterium]|nr:hypothetical protein [Sphingobacteriales bacterium]
METRIKRTYICKEVNAHSIDRDIPADYLPVAGDVAVFEVLHIGKHRNVQGESKRNMAIVPGDKIMAAFGTRYATEQFEGYLPATVDIDQELHILGAGGTVGVLASMHYKFKDIGPTTLRFAGFVKDYYGNIVNTKNLKKKQQLKFSGAAASATKVILSLGSSMDSGKTTSAAYLVHGLKKAGYKVAYIKLTGTVYTKDADLASDLGADIVSDFGDFGFPSTYMCDESELLDLYESVLSRVLIKNPDYVIMEIADGLYERETKMLLTSKTFKQTIEAVIFSAGDSLAAINGVNTLHSWGLYPVALSGLFTTSPLLIREVKENTTVPVYDIDQLATATVAGSLFSRKLLQAIN